MSSDFEEHLKKRGALNPMDPEHIKQINGMFGDHAAPQPVAGGDPIARLQYYIGRPVRVIGQSGQHLSGWVIDIDDTFITLNTNKSPVGDTYMALIATAALESIEEITITATDPRQHDDSQAELLVEQMLKGIKPGHLPETATE